MIKLISMATLTLITYGIYLETGVFTAGSIYTISVVLWNWIPMLKSHDNQRHMMFMSAMDDLSKIQKTLNRKMSSSLSPEQHDRLHNKHQDPS